MTELLLFSDRRKLSDEFEEWRKWSGVSDCPLAVITWLHGNGLLNLDEVRKHMTEKDEEGC